MNARGIIAVLKKETIELSRDPVTIAVALLMPLIMLFLFGYAVSLDVKDIRYGVWDLDRTTASRELADSFARSGYFVRAAELDKSNIEPMLLHGDIRMAVVIPNSFESRMSRGEAVPVQVLVDGTYSNVAQIIVGYADAIIASFRNGTVSSIEPEVRVWYNPSLRSANYVIPGLLGVIMMAFPPLLTALAVVREKESRSIEQIFASPLTSAEFLAGKLMPYGAIAFVEFLMVMAIGFLWFEVPFRGNIVLLTGAALVYVFTTVGLGLFVSTIVRTQVAAMLLALVVTLMPSALFSGFIFPVFTMPYALQLYASSFPARYFIDVARDVTLRGAGLGDVWVNIVLIVIYSAAVFAAAVWRFRKKVA
ncbi:ABC transporter permease [Mesorhizobium sp. VK24D]|uniref:ABC transporter permease n=1 Tax=Mesorhizobium album TaxID=3072314 RepID=A0ABU4XT86_9HYPH|nr:ABC transporter permease [Mesorhizobium sp. VK24D]MDX8477926.1 ABC transporter permease [Mesorhizobium sp. VK24D]